VRAFSFKGSKKEQEHFQVRPIAIARYFVQRQIEGRISTRNRFIYNSISELYKGIFHIYMYLYVQLCSVILKYSVIPLVLEAP